MEDLFQKVIVALKQKPLNEWNYHSTNIDRGTIRTTQKYEAHVGNLEGVGFFVLVTKIEFEKEVAAQTRSWTDYYYLSLTWYNDDREKIFEKEYYILEENSFIGKKQRPKNGPVKTLFDILEQQRISIN